MTLALRPALRSRLLRFVVTGAGAAALFVVLASLLAGAGMPPLLAGPLAYLIAFAFAYLTQRSWTFAAEQTHAVAFPRYLALQLGCAALSGAVSHVAVHWYGAAPLTMSLAAVLVTSAVSYVLSSRWVFARSGT
jgi:putative flippase GtrA